MQADGGKKSPLASCETLGTPRKRDDGLLMPLATEGGNHTL